MLKSAFKIMPMPWMTDGPAPKVLRALNGDAAEPRALFVGGCVRNTLLELPAGDMDIATTLEPGAATAALEAAGIKVVPTGIAHGTIMAVADGRPFEITSLRRDVETDGRRAVVRFTTDWAEDAERRDFTMNTLLADGDGHVYDPTGRGIDDLRAGRVVFVGDPAQRIAEDYLRILRFFRFHGLYGKGAADPAALAACRAAADKIATLSRERITQELFKILMLDDPSPLLTLMFENKVLSDLPEAAYDPAVLIHLSSLQKKAQALHVIPRLLTLAGANMKKLEKRLVFSNQDKQMMAGLAELLPELRHLSEKDIKLLIYKKGNALTLHTVLVFMARQRKEEWCLMALAKDWRSPAFPLNGEDVMAQGVKRGPEVGRVLGIVESWWLDQECAPDRAGCLRKLQETVDTPA